jgi:hypothetical protein
MEQKVIAELKRQAADAGKQLEMHEGGFVNVAVPIDVVALATAIVGSIAGGP